MDVLRPSALVDCFSDVEDPRFEPNVAHKLLDVIVLSVCAVVCGADSFTDIEEYGRSKEPWLRSFLELPNGIPSHDTIGRIFARVDPEQFRSAFLRWVDSVRSLEPGLVAVDGKVSRHSFDRAAGRRPLCMVSAWACEQGLVLGQVAVEGKSNEITAVPKLLDLLDVRGCVVTTDAMGCQRKIARKILEGGADYVLALKANHKGLYRHVGAFFEWAEARAYQSVTHARWESEEEGHGRREVRRCVATTDVEWLPEYGKWKGLASAVMVESERTEGGRTSVERRYFISSLGLEPRRLARAVRGHWRVENSLHWVLDLAFDEDASRVRTGNAPENLAVLRHLALSMLKREESSKRGIKSRRLRAGWDEAYLLRVLLG